VDDRAEPSVTAEGDVPTVAVHPDEVLACLSGEASDEQVTDLFERLSIPHESGTGTDLLPGIAGVAARSRGVAVQFEPSTPPARRAEIVVTLEEPPVVTVVDSAEGCP
jgi:hypothetical protein